MLEANESLENIFENAVKEAEKRKHEYVTIEGITFNKRISKLRWDMARKQKVHHVLVLYMIQL